MGLHICCNIDDQDHPDWDYLRRGNDRNFPSLIDWENTIRKVDSYGEEIGFRPTDMDSLKQRLLDKGWDDEERYLHLLSLVENNENVWLYFSY